MSARKNRRAKRKKKTQEDKIKKVKALLKPHPGKLSESWFPGLDRKIFCCLCRTLFSKTWYVIFRSDIIRTFKSSECSIDWRSKTDDWFPTTSVAIQCRHKKHWTHCCYCPPNVWYDRIAKLKTIKVHFHFLPFDLWWSFLTTRVIFLFLPFSDLQFSSLCLSLWYKTAKNVSYQNLKVHLK